MIAFCRVLLKRTKLEVALTAALYFSTLRVKLIARDIENIFTICSYLSYYFFNVVRDRSLFLRILFYILWWRVCKHPVVVCGDECIGLVLLWGGWLPLPLLVSAHGKALFVLVLVPYIDQS